MVTLIFIAPLYLGNGWQVAWEVSIDGETLKLDKTFACEADARTFAANTFGK